MMKKLVLIAMALFLLQAPALAKEIGGVKLPDTLAAGKDNLVLNGAGLRKKAFFKVYAGGLYLKQKSSDSAKIIAADEAMAIRMHWIRDVAGKKIVKGWTEGFANATGKNTAPIAESIKTFNSWFEEGVKKNGVHDIIYVPKKGLSLYTNGQEKGTLTGLEFKKAVFGIWLGTKVSVPKLKKAMLGN
ncbi:chalcone isomerase family protein [Desulfobacterales bacterium HSG16]|nr:chalcone isomerase family protein [Desulfobacterales bacterium HSG16]